MNLLLQEQVTPVAELVASTKEGQNKRGFVYESSRTSSSTFDYLLILLPNVTLSTVDNTNKNHDNDINVKISQNKVHVCKITFYC